MNSSQCSDFGALGYCGPHTVEIFIMVIISSIHVTSLLMRSLWKFVFTIAPNITIPQFILGLLVRWLYDHFAQSYIADALVQVWNTKWLVMIYPQLSRTTKQGYPGTRTTAKNTQRKKKSTNMYTVLPTPRPIPKLEDSTMSHANIITQVTPENVPAGYAAATAQADIDMGSLIKLNIRGEAFQITRDELMNLPESILLCLFPNGVFLDFQGNAITNLTEDDIVYVNFDPRCFEYIVNTFAEAASRLPSNVQPEVYNSYQMTDTDVLNEKPAIIVLREDLDYYVIPPTKGMSRERLKDIKIAAGQYLVSRGAVFEGLGYIPGKQLGAAEDHLLQMLCSSGFTLDSEWGHRSSEPGKTVLTSLALINLKGPEPEPTLEDEESDVPPSAALNPVQSNASSNHKQTRRSRITELATNAARSVSRNSSNSRKTKTTQSAGTPSKLFLFWRKPARKCWWSDNSIDLTLPNVVADQEALEVRVHIRRVWTLELSVIGVH